MHPRPCGLVTLLTDFGLQDPYVGVMKGALWRAAPKLQVVDLGHELPPQDVGAGMFFVAAAIGRFPAGTVHVAVVDPGVGSARKLLAVAARECYWLAPDNGLLSPVLATTPAAEVRAIDDAHLGLQPESDTFHGRDLLAPVAAWLASGRCGFSALGPRCEARVERSWNGGPPRVLYVDRYGNLITSLAGELLQRTAGVRIGGRAVARHRTYGDVRPGELLAYVGSFGLVEIAKNGGSAARELAVGAGAAVEVLAP